MTLTLCTSCFSGFLHPSSALRKFPAIHNSGNVSLLPLIWSSSLLLPCQLKFLKASASVSESDHEVSQNRVSELLDQELLLAVAGAKDAAEALQMIAEKSTTSGGVVNTSDCCLIISAALKRNNVDLVLSVFYAMRASFDQGHANHVPIILFLAPVPQYILFLLSHFGCYPINSSVLAKV